MVAKTPVSEIHIYDGDVFLQHNAFRSPGAASLEKLDRQMMKANYYAEIYNHMHKHVTPHSYYVTTDNIKELDGVNYVFICIDKGEARRQIADYLVNKGVSFIDVGLGVNIVDDHLIGTLRITTGRPDKNDHLVNRIPIIDEKENEYATNIQIADLNALNALLAVIKWKKLSGFYRDLTGEHHQLYSLTTSKIFNEDFAA